MSFNKDIMFVINKLFNKIFNIKIKFNITINPHRHIIFTQIFMRAYFNISLLFGFIYYYKFLRYRTQFPYLNF